MQVVALHVRVRRVGRRRENLRGRQALGHVLAPVSYHSTRARAHGGGGTSLARLPHMHRSLVLVDARDPRVERTWRLLEAQAQPPYFLSWGWIERWLGALPADHAPPLAVVEDDHAPVAAFFLGRHGDALFFNATGSPRHDELCIEHNGLLAAPGACRSLAQLVDLLPPDW